jgi:leucyl/phenylalanyl-tRNA--protein transferase
MSAWDFDFIDCQMPTPHLLSLGAKIISRKEFLHRLSLALEHQNKKGIWDVKNEL